MGLNRASANRKRMHECTNENLNVCIYCMRISFKISLKIICESNIQKVLKRFSGIPKVSVKY
jgi:hypothetical protein